MDRKSIKVFIASSSELKEERDTVLIVLYKLNKSHKHLIIEPILWEYDMVHSNYPGKKNIQGAINPKLKDSDLGVFIFYSKIGEFTREEFEYATSENKTLFAYFKTGFSPDRSTLNSYSELLDFKEDLSYTVLYESYPECIVFEKLLYENLNLYLAETYPMAAIGSKNNADERRQFILNLKHEYQQWEEKHLQAIISEMDEMRPKNSLDILKVIEKMLMSIEKGAFKIVAFNLSGLFN